MPVLVDVTPVMALSVLLKPWALPVLADVKAAMPVIVLPRPGVLPELLGPPVFM